MQNLKPFDIVDIKMSSHGKFKNVNVQMRFDLVLERHFRSVPHTNIPFD